MTQPSVRVYSRRGCHLCEQLIDDLSPLLRGRATLSVCDIDTRPEWVERFNEKVPVVEVDGTIICEHFLDRDTLESTLAAAR